LAVAVCVEVGVPPKSDGVGVTPGVIVDVAVAVAVAVAVGEPDRLQNISIELSGVTPSDV
jgi:hypothetical protein